MQYTNLVMLDIKHIDPEKHKALTAQENKGILAFAKYLEEKMFLCGFVMWSCLELVMIRLI